MFHVKIFILFITLSSIQNKCIRDSEDDCKCNNLQNLNNIETFLKSCYSLVCENCCLPSMINIENLDYHHWLNFIFSINRNCVPITKIKIFPNWENIHLNLDNNQISTLFGLIDWITRRNLVHLSLDNNLITKIDLNDFENIHGLRNLSLRNNLITFIHNEALKNLYYLEYLDLSLNYLTNLNSEIFENCNHLRILKINANHMNRINVNKDWFSKLPKNLELVNTKFMYSFENSLTHLNYFPKRPIRDFVRNLSRIDKQLFQNVDCSFITEIDLKLLHIQQLSSNSFKYLNCLIKLDISMNFLSEIKFDFFHGLENLQQLLINFNKLEIIDDLAFNNLKNLHYLSLNHNRLKVIVNKLFNPLNNLVFLDLSHNYIKLNNIFQHNKVLKFLNLSFNLIEQINIQFNNLHEINIDHNLISDDNFNIIEFLKYSKQLKLIKINNNLFSNNFYQQLNSICNNFNVQCIGSVIKSKPNIYNSKFQLRIRKIHELNIRYQYYLNVLIFLAILPPFIILCLICCYICLHINNSVVSINCNFSYF